MNDDKNIICSVCDCEFSYSDRSGGDNQCFCPKCGVDLEIETFYQHLLPVSKNAIECLKSVINRCKESGVNLSDIVSFCSSLIES